MVAALEKNLSTQPTLKMQSTSLPHGPSVTAEDVREFYDRINREPFLGEVYYIAAVARKSSKPLTNSEVYNLSEQYFLDNIPCTD